MNFSGKTQNNMFATMNAHSELLQQTTFTHSDLVRLLNSRGENRTQLFEQAKSLKLQTVGNKVYFRGLIEFSNICSKDSLYCGIRKSNDKLVRYEPSDEEILEACMFAWKNKCIRKCQGGRGGGRAVYY